MPSSLQSEQKAANQISTPLTAKDYRKLGHEANRARRTTLELALKAGGGHVTTAFSQAELLVALYLGGILRHDPQRPEWVDRDRVVISKGHGCMGLYPILSRAGYFPASDLERVCGALPEKHDSKQPALQGTDARSNSLGHGLPIATGIAQVGKNDRASWLVFCLLGDAELYEGSNWEAATYAAHAGLGNLVCIVDRNKQGVLGFTDDGNTGKDGPHLESLENKFRAFGFETRRFNGHDFEQIFDAFADIRDRDPNKPLMLIADTIKGKGSPVMENQRLWHWRIPKGEQLQQVYADLDAQRLALDNPTSSEGSE